MDTRIARTTVLVAVLAAAGAILFPPTSSVASGCTVNWDGGATGAWDVGSNWSDDAIPDSNDQVCVGGNATVSVPSSQTVHHFHIESGVTLNVNGGVALRALANSFNAGTINMQNNSGLRAEDGDAGTTETLTNTGTISATGGGGAGFNGNLANQGTITITNPDFGIGGFHEPRAPTIVNSGTLTVNSPGAFAVGGTFENAGGGSVTGNGRVNVSGDGSLLRVTGGSIAASVDFNVIGGFQAGGADVTFGAGAGSATGQIDLQDGVNSEQLLTGNVPAGYAIDLSGGNARLRSLAGFTNAGTINVNGATALQTEDGDAGTVETLTNTGTIAAAGGSIGGITGNLVNQGTITVSHSDFRFSAGAEARSPTLANAGTIAVQTDGVFTGFSSTIELGAGGTVNGPGRLAVYDDTALLRVTGGTISANGDVRALGHGGNGVPGADLVFDAPGGASGPITVSGGFGPAEQRISGNVPAGVNLTVTGNGAFLRANADWTNAGTITLTGAITLRTEDGTAGTTETLTNTGTLSATGGGTAVISGDLNSTGAISVSHGDLRFQHGQDGGRAPTLRNAGNLSVADGGVLSILSSTLELATGGTVSGPGRVSVAEDAGLLRVTGGTVASSANLKVHGGTHAGGADLAFAAPSGAIGTINSVDGFNSEQRISGNVPTGITIAHTGANARLRAFASFTNAGTINLKDGAALQTEDGDAGTVETLTNTGTIVATGGATGGVSGNLTNQGTLTVDHNDLHYGASAEARQPTLTNAAGGTIEVRAGKSFANGSAVPIQLQGGVLSGTGTAHGAWLNSGAEVRPAGGNATGVLTINGSYTQGPGGTYSVDVIGSSHDRLQVNGNVSLDGLLEVDSSGIRPPIGSRLQILTPTGTRTGTFSDAVGLLGGWEVDYPANRIELVRVSTADMPGFEAGDASVVEGDSGSTNLVIPVTVAPSAPEEEVEVDYEVTGLTATAGSDFTTVSGTLVFASDDPTGQVVVPVHGDTSGEPNETVSLRLRNASGLPIRDPRGIGTIVGDDISLTDVTPDRGGTPGQTTVTVTGTGFGAGSTLTLERGGEEIDGGDPAVDTTGTHLTATFDLADAELGAWDVTATGTGGTSLAAPGAFTVEPAAPGRVVVSATNPARLRFGFVGDFVVTLRNTGNVDLPIELIRIASQNVEVRRQGEGLFGQTVLNLDADDPADEPGPPLGVLPPGEPRTLTIEYTSTTQVAHATLRLRASVFTRDGLDSSIALAEGTAEDEAEALPDPLGQIDAVVRTPAGDPIPGVPVTARRTAGPDRLGSTRVALTGGDGTTSFPGLEDGAYEVSLGGGLGALADRRQVEITPGDRDVDLAYTTSLSELAGSVRRADNSRVGGASVFLHQDGRIISGEEADGGGGFRLLVAKPGSYDLIAIHPSIGFAVAEDIEVAAGTAVAGVRLMAGAATLDVDTSPGAKILVRRQGMEGFLALSATASGSGDAAISGLPPGTYDVRTSLDGRAPRRDTIAVTAAGANLAAPLSSGASAVGEITGDGGSPAEFAQAWAIDAATGTVTADRVDANGEYEVEPLTPGPVDLWLTAPGYVPEHVTGPVAPGGGSVTVDAQLEREGFEVPFLITNIGTDAPIVGALVEVLDPTGRANLHTGITDVGGEVLIGPLAEGDYRVRVSTPGSPPVERALAVGPPATKKVTRVPTDEELLNLETYEFRKPPPDIYDLDTSKLTGEDFLTGLTPPTRQGPDEDGTWSTSYQKVVVPQPCPQADSLRSSLDQSRANLDRAFLNWQSAYLALTELNQANVNRFAAQSGLIGTKLLALFASINGGFAQAQSLGNIDPALADNLARWTGIMADSIQNYRASGDPHEFTTPLLINSTAGLVDTVRGTPVFSSIYGTYQSVMEIVSLVNELDEAFDKDFQAVIYGYGSAEKQYRDAVVRHHILMRLHREAAEACPEDEPEPDPLPNPPRQPRPDGHADGETDNFLPNDPNDIEGPMGAGAPRHIKPDGNLGYRIRFENIGPGTVSENPPGPPANSPAVLVTIDHTLDAAVDLETFALGDLGWGDVEVDVPAGAQSYHGEVPLPDGDVVAVDASLDTATRKVTWKLETIDPETGELEDDPAGGFLPPEPVDDPGAGQGRVTYTARLLDSVPHGTEVDAEADIRFDFNPVIATPTWTNTVDRTAPATAVSAAAQPGVGTASCQDELNVDWGGTDAGSGLALYAVLVSKDGAPYELWQAPTSGTSANLRTDPGSTYRFVSLGTDAVGNLEPMPTNPDLTRKTELCDELPPTITGSAGGTAWRRSATVNLSGADPFGGTGVKEITYALSGGQTGGATVQDDATSFTVGSEGVTTVAFSGKDFVGNASAPRTLTVRVDRTGPTIRIDAPADGAQVTVGQALSARYSCEDPLSGVVSCEGTVASGANLSTATPGAKTLTVTATDVAGNVATATRGYTVVAAAGPLKVRATLGRMKKAKVAPVKIINESDSALTGRVRLVGKKGGRPGKALSAWKSFQLGAGQSKVVRLRLKRPARRALAKGRKLEALAQLDVTGAGQKALLSSDLRLKLRPVRKH